MVIQGDGIFVIGRRSRVMDYVSSEGRAKGKGFDEGIGLGLSLNPRRKKVRFVF